MSAAARSCRRAFFPPGYFTQVPATTVPATLRACFGRWGLPHAVRVDNGSPWGSWSDWPGAFPLWLIGLGIAVIWNDPRRPQQNGVVERSQGTGKRWAEPGACTSVAQLQGRLEADDRRQREAYPYAEGQSRLEFYPALVHSGRCYDPVADAQRCDFAAVLGHLAGYVVPRRVDRSGTISVWNRTHYVGSGWSGRTVWVSLDPLEVAWVIADEHGTQIRVKPAKELTPQAILALNVAGSK
jgi:hypothetical protein